ncbi:MAG: hypothetical protein J7K40_05090 [candidate division Zixibacteria bacterium]|nr:hypothetical protein [candidate division Zixibacteria bacterium]
MSHKQFFDAPGGKKPDDNTKPTPDEQELLNNFAEWIVKKGLTVPAIMFFEMSKPLNWIGSQAMLVAEPAAWALAPFLQAFFGLRHEDYLKFQKLMEKRHSMESFILTIENYDAEAKIKEKEIKKKYKAEKKELKAKKKAKRKKFFRKVLNKKDADDFNNLSNN